ncbi:MAG TPA: FtsX-like permease family protein [Gemmatimonadales bacterium]|nr:FtsX-like permease family protein [Gemmatimonadales bacterium]
MSARFVWQMAVREARAARRRLLLLTASVTAGTGALVAVNSFADNLTASVAEQAQALLGADLSFRSRAPLDSSARVSTILDSLRTALGDRAAVAHSASFTAMAYLEGSGGTRLVQVRTVDPGWPYYGAIETAPAGTWPRLQDGAVIVDPSLLAALDARIGDTLALGEARYPIAATVVNVPGDVGLQEAFGARVYIATATVPSTGLLGFGARVRYETFVKLPAEVDAQSLAEGFRPTLREDRVGVRTVADDRDDLTDGLTRLANYLGLVALAALLLGGLGVASAVQVFIRQRLDSIAVLRCLGATTRQVFAIHLIQALAMGLLGSVIGAALGIGLQMVMPLVLADFLPVDVVIRPSWRAIALGVGLGVWTAGVFSLLPLLGIREASPLATLRRLADPPRVRWDGPRLVAVLLLVTSVVALAAVQVGSLVQGAWFAAGVGMALAALWAASLLTVRAARRFTPARWSYLVRQGLANLHRPGNQTVTVVVALGFGAFLLVTLFAAQHNLLRDFRVDSDEERPNLVFIDIQTDQRATVREALATEGITNATFVPIVPMRVLEVDGRRVSDILGRGRVYEDTTATPEGEDAREGSMWAFRREYRSTYRAALGGSERVTLGRFYGDTVTATGRTAEDPAPISMEAGVAGELIVGVGDRITWDVQGVPVYTVVTSLREVEWARFEPNFFVLFPPGVLDRAPQTWVTLARVTDPTVRGRLQRVLAERAANVTSVDLGQVQRALEQVLDRVILAIRFMALFSLATGAVVLVGAIATSRWQRIREGTLLRTLGASRRQVLRILGVEYAALGVAAALVATVLAGGAGWALSKWVFETRFTLPLVPMTGLALGLATLTTVVGLWSSQDVLDRPPLEVLSREG